LNKHSLVLAIAAVVLGQPAAALLHEPLVEAAPHATSQPEPARAGDDVPVTWKGKTYASGELPGTLNESQKRALFAWIPWAREHDYRCDFDAQGRIVVLSSTKGSSFEKRMQIVGRTESWFDALLPAPGATAATSGPASGVGTGSDVGGIPEDPESAPAGAPRPAAATSTKPLASDGATAVMLVVRTEKDFASALEVLAEHNPGLRDWAKTATKHTGFVVEEGLCGAYVENASGQEEWNADHELVNRVAQLLVLRRFGQVPFWLAQGIAWEAETSFDGSLYCFPYRDEFVGIGEHTGWPSELRNQFKDRASSPFSMDDVARWKRGTFDASAAHVAWGTVHFIAAHHPGKLGALLADLRKLQDEEGRRQTGATTWERIPGYEIAPAKQQELFVKHLGRNFFKEATAWFRNPDSAPKNAPPKSTSEQSRSRAHTSR
jgi:hypothetical protein